MTVERAAVEGNWVHSHEEDTAGERIFRPASYGFPPSRGRSALDLRADGSYGESAPGPTDRPVEVEGAWSLAGDTLELRPHDGSTRTLEVVSAESDRLVVRT